MPNGIANYGGNENARGNKWKEGAIVESKDNDDCDITAVAERREEKRREEKRGEEKRREESPLDSGEEISRSRKIDEQGDVIVGLKAERKW